MMKSLLIALLLPACMLLASELYLTKLELQKRPPPPTCEAVQMQQCMNFWFTGNPIDKSVQRHRMCGGKKH